MKLIVKNFDTVLEGNKVIGLMAKQGEKISSRMVYQTFLLIYEHGIEEIDIYSLNSRGYDVAQALGNSCYTKGFKLKSLDDYNKSR